MMTRLGIVCFTLAVHVFCPWCAWCSGAEEPTMGAPVEPITVIDYETGTLNSGIPGVAAHLPPAKDSVTLSTNVVRTGKFAMRSKVALDDSYMSSKAHRAESSAMKLMPARYSEGDYIRYQFSVYLSSDWQIDTRDAVDIIWQFKRFGGGPDMFVGVKGRDIVLRSDGGGEKRQDLLLRDYPRGEWMDFRFDVRWSAGTEGSVVASVRKKGEKDYTAVASFTGPNTRDGRPKSAYLKWGLYKPGFPKSTISNARVVYHDDISVQALKK